MFADLLQSISSFFFPPSCISCSSLIDVNNEDCLCKDCRARWEYAKISVRNSFSGEPVIPVQIKGNTRTLDSFIASLVNYRQNTLKPDFNVQRQLIFKLKRYNYSRMINFFTEELADLIENVTDCEFDPDRTVFTSMPRNPMNYINTMNDGVREVTKALADEFGCKYLNAFSKSLFAKEQKYLSRRERKLNGSKLRLNNKAFENTKFKTAFIIDDVVTTGSTVTEAARLLVNETKVRNIYIFSIAQNSDTLIRKL